MSLRTLAVIPARFESSRFPGKPLADLDGVPMVVRVCRAAAASRADEVLVATDHGRVVEVVREAGFRAVLTGEHPSGSDRVREAVRHAERIPDLVLNVQGDEPLVDPADIDALLASAAARPHAIGTLARPFEDASEFEDPNAVKVVVDREGHALYFSRAPIPFGARAAGSEEERPLLHVGLYAYPGDLLARFTSLPPSRLERMERLEQLRALENGIPIHVTRCVSERPGIGVDVPEDVERVVREIRRRSNANLGRRSSGAIHDSQAS